MEAQAPKPRKTIGLFFKGAGAVAGICLALLVPLLVLFLLLKGSTWIFENVYPWIRGLGAVAFGLTLFVFLPLSIFRRARPLAGLAIYACSFAQGLAVWFWGYFVALFFAGTFWLIFGLLFMGFGVVPVALVAALIRGEWLTLGEGILDLFLVFGSRATGLYIIHRAERDEPLRSAEP